jgi:hypothetical protein
MNFLITYEDYYDNITNIFVNIEEDFKKLFNNYKILNRIKSYRSSLYASLLNDNYIINININHNGSYHDLSEKLTDVRYDLTITLINGKKELDSIIKSYIPISYNKEYRHCYKNCIKFSSNKEIINDIIETCRNFIDENLYLFDSSDLGLL